MRYALSCLTILTHIYLGTSMTHVVFGPRILYKGTAMDNQFVPKSVDASGWPFISTLD